MNTPTRTSTAPEPNPLCIPSNYARLIARELDLQARDLAGLLHSTQLSTQQLMEEDTLLTAQQLLRIFENALVLAKHDSFGLRFGRRLTPTTHGAMGFLAHSSPNLLLAIEAFQTYLPTRVYFIRLALHREGDFLRCELHFDLDISPAVHRVLTECVLVILLDTAEFIVGRPVDEASISIAHSAPCYSAEYDQYFPGDVTFSATQTCLKLPISLCYIPNASANAENYVLAQQQCESMLAQLNTNQRTEYQVQKMMLSQPPGTLTEEEAAAALFISKRTLARRLKKEGTSFRQLRDKILSQLAGDHLRCSQLSVDAIAALLNYTDRANFLRAFKRWFQMTPSEYRRQISPHHGDRVAATPE